MRTVLTALGWLFLGADSIALLFFLNWSLTASARDGEIAYAIVALLLTLALVGVGGGLLVFSAKRKSLLGLWCSTLLLGAPPVTAVSMRIINSL